MDARTEKILEQLTTWTLRLVQNPEACVYVELGEIYRQLERVDDALIIAAEGTRRHPAHGPGFAMLGRLRVASDDLQGAEEALEKAVSLTGEDPALIYDLAMVKFQLGKERDCRSLLQRLLTLAPEHPQAKALLTRLGPARETATLKVRGDEKKPFATATLAEIYVKQGYLNRALQVYKQLAANEPHNQKLQQRVAELRGQVSKGAEPPQNEKTEVQDVASAEISGATQTPEAEGASLTAAEEEPGPRIVRELERWLRAVAKRRANVR